MITWPLMTFPMGPYHTQEEFDAELARIQKRIREEMASSGEALRRAERALRAAEEYEQMLERDMLYSE